MSTEDAPVHGRADAGKERVVQPIQFVVDGMFASLDHDDRGRQAVRLDMTREEITLLQSLLGCAVDALDERAT